MNLREMVIKAALIATLGGVLMGGAQVLGWVAETDAQVEQGMREAYCIGVATWQAEAARGVPELQRTGHPDYDESAADKCPGLRPAGHAANERQLAHN